MGGVFKLMKTKKNIMEIFEACLFANYHVYCFTPIYYLLVTTFKSGTEAAAKPMALPSFPGILHHISGV